MDRWDRPPAADTLGAMAERTEAEGRKMGLVAEEFGVQNAIISGGHLCVIAVLLLSFLLPKFLRYDGREGVKQKEIEEATQNAAAAETKL